MLQVILKENEWKDKYEKNEQECKKKMEAVETDLE